MGWRFSKSIRIAKGVRINLSRKGVGASVGIPGTGLRYVASPSGRKGKASESAGPGCLAQLFIATFKVAGLAVVAILLVGVIMAMTSPTRTYRASDAPAPAASPAFGPGDRVVVFDPDMPRAGGVNLVLRPEDVPEFEAAHHRLANRIGVHAGEAQKLMYEAGKLKLWANRSEAEVVEATADAVKVRLTSGEGKGFVGWVAPRCLERR